MYNDIALILNSGLAALNCDISIVSKEALCARIKKRRRISWHKNTCKRIRKATTRFYI